MISTSTYYNCLTVHHNLLITYVCISFLSKVRNQDSIYSCDADHYSLHRYDRILRYRLHIHCNLLICYYVRCSRAHRELGKDCYSSGIWFYTDLNTGSRPNYLAATSPIPHVLALE